ncbi:LysM peptidoglycan-binding domain-containing protein [Heyndrickxia oleronia]|uniref:LysM domain-containing protein n=1 Tax=Heyndrickxia oleronia TaxID=38875 RepID=A0A8E2LFH2_9BACI|nr:LysM peptidoglycan-binding domain-containing protein [Heyndrickxia oleronia]MCI1593598.1 LysM peptidoglycan-binding domain-containing protein [Heyndrickxia oleronia]MCI1615964.1 LysM peptidoglycan-binding domain-containing protein [Heyndrickxia oleronia]MCI1746560.1 LysM peptidoglycan-binding domain-containing protein [Heyndrickxia oleronia]MCI1764359.1 LysM peptidoglycan-binding domain-containing protein [Heyndrickxia oleronia]MCM3455475.1 LysM peptidoglycan-binding domain-containing prote
MKKILAFVAVIIVIYSIYIDLNFGTIPAISHASEVKENTKPSTAKKPFSYKEIIIKPGDTVLSVVEEVNKIPLSVSIDKVINDFIQLNNGIKPEEIQIGQIYKIPLY